MLYEHLDTQDLYELLKGIFDSIREINRRIDELGLVMKHGWCTEDGRQKISARVADLIESRLYLSTSIHEIRNHIVDHIKCFGEKEQKELKALLDRDDFYGQLRKL